MIASAAPPAVTGLVMQRGNQTPLVGSGLAPGQGRRKRRPHVFRKMFAKNKEIRPCSADIVFRSDAAFKRAATRDEREEAAGKRQKFLLCPAAFKNFSEPVGAIQEMTGAPKPA